MKIALVTKFKDNSPNECGILFSTRYSSQIWKAKGLQTASKRNTNQNKYCLLDNSNDFPQIYYRILNNVKHFCLHVAKERFLKHTLFSSPLFKNHFLKSPEKCAFPQICWQIPGKSFSKDRFLHTCTESSSSVIFSGGTIL